MCIGCLLMAAKATDSRNNVPLPLFWLPSISNSRRSLSRWCLGRFWVKFEVANN
jgi:hypothetical protein